MNGHLDVKQQISETMFVSSLFTKSVFRAPFDILLSYARIAEPTHRGKRTPGKEGMR